MQQVLKIKQFQFSFKIWYETILFDEISFRVFVYINKKKKYRNSLHIKTKFFKHLKSNKKYYG